MYTQDNLAFVLVPGSFSTSYPYHKVTSQLRERGFTVTEISLPSTSDRHNQKLPPGDMHSDAAAIHTACKTLLDSGKNVVLAMHSYSGLPGSESIQGLAQVERGNGITNPNTTRVIGLVYIAAFMISEGISINQKLASTMPPVTGEPNEPTAAAASESGEGPIKFDGEYMYHTDPATMRDIVFNDIPDVAVRQHYYDTMPIQSKVSFEQGAEFAGWKVVPATYILCRDDLVVAPEVQLGMIREANEVLGHRGKVQVVELDSGHAPIVSRPDDVVRILLGAASIR